MNNLKTLHEDIFNLCFDRWKGTFAGGQPANNKFDAEVIAKNRPLRPRVAKAVGQLAAKYQPDMLVAVPNGANWLAIDLAWALGAAIVLLDKDPETKEISYRPHGQEQVETAKRIVIIEDVPNRRTTTARVLALPGMAERVKAEAAILDRGMPGEQLSVPIPVDSIFSEPIPAMLPADSPLWRFASEAARG